MNDLELEVRRLRNELEQKAEEIADLRKLVGREIDREFSAPAEELSDKELRILVQELLTSINGLTDARPDLRAIASHRKTLGKPVAFLKRALLETTFARLNSFANLQIQFDEKTAEVGRALLVRTGRQAELLKTLEAKIAGLEEDLILVRTKLEDFKK